MLRKSRTVFTLPATGFGSNSRTRKSKVIPTDVIFQHHFIVSLEDRLFELVSQLLCYLLDLSVMKSDSQASTFVQGMFICDIKVIPCSPSLKNREQVVHEQEVDGLVDII